MIVHLFGPDAYRRQARLRELIAAHEARYSRFSVAHFDVSENEAAEKFAAFLRNASLFDEAKFAVVHAENELPETMIGLIESLAADADRTAAVVATDRIKDLPRQAACEEFPALQGEDRIAFIRAEAKKRGFTPSPATIGILAALPFDSWGISTELDALALGGSVAAGPREPEFFPLVQSLRHAAAPVRLSALAYLLEREEPAKVFNILAALLDQAGKRRMADYDVAVKSGKLEYEEALLDYVLA